MTVHMSSIKYFMCCLRLSDDFLGEPPGSEPFTVVSNPQTLTCTPLPVSFHDSRSRNCFLGTLIFFSSPTY